MTIPTDIQALITRGDTMFSDRMSLMSYWQEVAENFCPHRAEFTMMKDLGADFASDLTSSVPILAQRDLGSLVSSMLRPNDKDWFKVQVFRMDKIDQAGKIWLDQANITMKRAMYDPRARFTRAAKEADNDFVTFGQAVMTVELGMDGTRLLYRTWHLRDVAWEDNAEGDSDTFHRNWDESLRGMNKYFNGKIHPEWAAELEKNPSRRIRIRHIIMPREDYYKTLPGHSGHKWVELYIDTEKGFVLQELAVPTKKFVIPRWLKFRQYAYSPCTIAALPEARTLQAMALTMLDASEKASSPPAIANSDAMRSDANFSANGITWLALEPGQRVQDALQYLNQDFQGMRYGAEMYDKSSELIKEAFYLNKIGMPPATQGDKMTAAEVMQRVNDYVRNALPLFEPMEQDYNAEVCDQTFELMISYNGFGSRADIPESLRKQDVQFNFYSPLHDAIEKNKSTTFQQAQAMISEAIQFDPTLKNAFDTDTAWRDTMEGMGAPPKWLRSKEDADAITAQEAKAAQAQQQMASLQQGADAAQKIGAAAQSFGSPAAS